MFRCTASVAEPTLPPAGRTAVLVIGTEILSGSVTDTNTPWLAKLLYSRGVDLVRVEVISDDKEDIAATALRLRELVGSSGAVITSGGIGPTHDDVTYEALAAAHGVSLEVHEATAARMQQHYDARGIELNAARLRMATLPATAEVLEVPGTWVPLVNLRGTYVLPGVPRLFRSMLEAHIGRFAGPAHRQAELLTDMGEGDLADPLREIAREHPGVSVGSYPADDALPAGDRPKHKVRLVLSCRDEAALASAVDAVRSRIATLVPDQPAEADI
ncbi:hypothetical protein WJX81_000539 [Elliptochloris bilobata]|uniref:MoaB/Mog domain-containing protein n=1 Tax=Elliptochloris bilobata TaxID=381761 RepID=A0AAW1S0R9_9CHLO